MTDWILRLGWPLLATTAIKSLFVLLLAGIAAVVLRRASAAARHLVWSVAIFGLLILPVVSLFPARWQIQLLLLSRTSEMGG